MEDLWNYRFPEDWKGIVEVFDNMKSVDTDFCIKEVLTGVRDKADVHGVAKLFHLVLLSRCEPVEIS